ncbi:MAG: hypothetical protein ACR2NL_07830, partial [Acidimicrobiia bacterium]
GARIVCEKFHEEFQVAKAANRRPIDDAILKFYGALAGATILFFGVLIIWTAAIDAVDSPYLNVSFTLSWLIAILMAVVICEVARRRPVEKVATWGAAMVAATFTFFGMFWIYGVVPHQFLTYSDSELAWRSDKILVGPPLPDWWAEGQGLIEWALPLTISYQTIRDLMVVGIYAIALGLQIWLTIIWQNRGKEGEVVSVEESTYGRPLVREGVSA